MANPKSGRRPRARKSAQRQRRAGLRSRGADVLAPGAGAVTRRAFGGASYRHSLACWDAKSPIHLPLPRATGPYTIIRVTRRFSNNARVNILGTYVLGESPNTACCVADVNSAQAMNHPDNAQYYAMDLGGIGAAATVVPSAFSVQVMNPNALQTTAGIVYAGVMHTQAAVAGRAETWDSWANKFVEFQNPRILTAPKLALRGVQINSFPLNMSALADFRPVSGLGSTGGAFTWTSSEVNVRGFAPIVVYNATDAVPPQLEFLVTTEYRVRFDLDNVAAASHKQHPIATDKTWADLMARATSMGNGVIDIVEKVADAGEMMTRGNRALARLGGVAALV